MKELYDNRLGKEWIDWVEKSNGTREEEIFPVLKEWLHKARPKIVVDIGCGQGICSALVPVGTEYIGIDPSKILLARARRLYRDRNKRFVHADAYDTHLEDCSVDTVISVWVWSHLQNLKAAAKEMHRVLKPGGKYFMITANPETYDERKTFYTKYKITGNLLRGTFDLGNGKTLTNTTLYLHTKDELTDSIRYAGLTIHSTKRIGRAETSNKGLYLAVEGSKPK